MIYIDRTLKEIFFNMLSTRNIFGYGIFLKVGNSEENRVNISYVLGDLRIMFFSFDKTFYNFKKIFRPLFIINRFLKDIINIIFEVFYFINTVFNFKTFYLRIDSFDCVDLVSDTNYRKYKNGFSFYFDNYLYRSLFYCVINIFSSWKAIRYIENNYDGEVSSNETIISEQEYLGSTNSKRDLIAEASEDGHPYQIYR